MPSGRIAFASLTKTFADGTEAVAPVDLTIERGELVALVGPSGCGKSTMLRIAAGLDSATSGSARCEGRVGFVFQDSTLLPWRSVRRNVELGAELDGVGRTARAARAADAIAMVGLNGFEDHCPAALSGGMRMRASLARALVLQPDAFLFDEPFGALDEITRERLNEQLLQIFQAQPFAGLFVTHNIFEAVFLSTRVAVMSHRPGRITRMIDVPFGFPREPELRFTPEFAALAGEVSGALRGDRALSATRA